MSIERTFDLIINAGTSSPLVINANQNDSGEIWKFNLYQEDGTKVIPAAGEIVGLKSDGHAIVNAGTVNESGQVVITETAQITAAVGANIFEIVFDSVHGTANFILYVEKSPVDDDADFSESDISAIQQAIAMAIDAQTVAALQNGLAQESATRAAQDAQLAGDISEEATTRAAADAVLRQAIDDAAIVPAGSTVVVDNTLSIAGAAADAKKTGDAVSDLNQAVTIYTDNAEITMVDNAYYDLSGNSITVGSPIENSSKKYALVPCNKGDIFNVSCNGGTLAQPWAFVDSAGNILIKTGNIQTVTINGLELVAPENAAYLVLNDDKSSTLKSYFGRALADRVRIVEDEAEKALTLADDGNVLVLMPWEQGVISQNDGSDEKINMPIRCRTSGYLTRDVKIKVNRSSIQYGTYLYYYDSNKNFIRRTDKITDEEITPDDTYAFYRVAVLDNSDFNKKISAIDADINFTFYKDNSAIDSLHQDISEIRNDLIELRVGNLINGRLMYNETDTSSEYAPYRLSTTEIVALPFGKNRTLKVNINKDYLVSLRAGASSTVLDVSLYWFKNGDTITIPDGCNYYGISVCNAAGNETHMEKTISPSENIGLKLYAENSFDILEQNDEADKLLSAAKLFFSSEERNQFNKYAVIGHTSDCHGDYKRVDNFLRYCDNCGADVACITGDIVSYKPSQGLDWFSEMLLSHDVLPAVCTGNHDVYDSEMTDSDVYDFMFDDIASKIGNTTGKTWYYKDVTDKKLRVISINLFQYGGTERWYSHFTNEQLSWFVSALASTPEDYGIIILTHSPQVNIGSAKDPNYGDFFQNARLYNNTFNAVNGTPVYDIVDAFISRTTLSRTYTQTGSPDSVSVSADFTSVDSSVEFIAHLTGHFHQDSICYLPGTVNKQLMLNVVCTNSIYGGSAYPYLADIQDIGRCNSDSTQDAFNMYVIDRDTKTVKVIRVGSNITYEMHERKFMAIPYAD